jgi:tripartite-type tricarboxylate transporter receptor subunit TctC
MIRRCVALVIACGILMGAASDVAHAQSVEQFYKGRQMTMIVGTAPGGINDITARFVARHLGRYVPGNPAIVVQNQPGAGGIASANRLYNTFERDGSVIVKLERAVPMLAIQGDPNVNFDPLKITWLGSLSSYAKDSYLMLVMATNPITSVAELKEPGKSITLGGDNAASSNLIFATIAKEILGLNIKVVRGYVGAAPMFMAMQSGEIDGQIIGYSSVRTGQRDRPQRAGADRFRQSAICHFAAVRGAARHTGGPRQNAGRRVHGHVQRPRRTRRSGKTRHRDESHRRRDCA